MFGIALAFNSSLLELHILNTLSVGTTVNLSVPYVSVVNSLVEAVVHTDFVCKYIYSTVGCDGSSLHWSFFCL